MRVHVATLTITPAGHYTTTVTQAGGMDWNAAIWQLDGAGNSVSPTAGNTYELIANGTAIGNNQAETRTRNPAVAGIQTFPGDSLTLNTNTEIRMKQAGAILNFPGVNGQPGLILNGGLLNSGDASAIFEVTGRVAVVSQSYLCPGNNDGTGVDATRGIIISSQLSGNGTLVLFEAGTNNAVYIMGTGNTFSGQWIVKAGWLSGYTANSLGTNSITIDPFFVLPVPPFSDTAPVVDLPGPAVLEVNYDLQSAGTLTLTNGGLMRLHQNCTFSAVVIEGTKLSSGAHPYAQLLASYPNNFEAGGSGGITVGTIQLQPVPLVIQRSGTNLQLTWSQGTLMEAPSVTGPWTANNATSPYTVTPTGTMKFYQVKVR